MNKSLLKIFAIGGLLALILSGCESMKFSMMKDDELIKGGVEAWNSDKMDAAKVYWTNIKDPAVKAMWLGRFTQESNVEKAFSDEAALPTTPEAPVIAGWKDAVKQYQDFPPELKLPGGLKEQLVPVAKAVVRQRINAGNLAGAREFIKTSQDFLGTLVEFSAEQKEMDAIAVWHAQELTADEGLATAKSTVDFNDQIDAYEAAIAGFAKVETNLTASDTQNHWASGSPLTGAADKLKRKRVDAQAQRDHLLRERAYSFKDRIGEEFARTPPSENLPTGSSSQAILKSDQDILAFNQEVKTNVEGMQTELQAFNQKYPKVVDKDMLNDIETQKQAIDARIAGIAVELKDVQEVISRGKPVTPLLIGLFNPVPGTKGNDQKSRPGKYRGTMTSDKDYLWGMVEIPKGTLNDLVITVSDGRQVRVFDDNTKSGSQIDAKKLKDLVNRGNKVGNSWPVMNAGSQLVNGKYYFELEKSKAATYSGDVVVYSSFITRMR